MSRDVTKAETVLQEVFKELKASYEGKYPGRNMFLTHVDRTPAEQLRLFCQGRLDLGHRVTNCDGYNKLSRHNHIPSQAIDVAVMDHGVIVWEDKYFEDIGNILFQLGYSGEVEWGGDWKEFRDMYHIQTRV